MKAGDCYKVGIAVDVEKRLKTIQTSNPYHVSLVACRLVEHAEVLESQMHMKLATNSSGGGREWFSLMPDRAIDVAVALNEPVKPVKKIHRSGDGLVALEQQALVVFTATGRASTSLLQRRLSIGYAKAARVLDSLEAKGLVTPRDGLKPRDLTSR